MNEICHVTVEGPCITQGSTAWGRQEAALQELKERVAHQCAAVRRRQHLRHGLYARIHFYLHGRRLKQTDLDNMAKVVLDAAFSSESESQCVDRAKDRFVWGLDLRKIESGDAESQRTEIWFFDRVPGPSEEIDGVE